MFTGIVEEIGNVISMKEESGQKRWDGSIGDGYILIVECKVCLIDCYVGASIAVNGVCLTATHFDDKTVTFGVAPETIRKTNLVKLDPGSKVNMERAAKMGDRNSGHYVQGHVDGTGVIMHKEFEGESLWITVQVPVEMLPQIVYKGFIAVDGTSLTICAVDNKVSTFKFMLVSHTQNHVIIPHKAVGDLVNIETDVMAKFVANSTAALVSRIEELESKIGSIDNKNGSSTIASRLESIEESIAKLEG